jgi:hypothetical protein
VSDNEDWWNSISVITEHLKVIMVEIWPDEPVYPGPIELYSLAVRVQVRKDLLHKTNKLTRAKTSPLVTAAKKFQQELSAEQDYLQKQVPAQLHDFFEKDIENLEKVRKAVETIIEKYKPTSRYDPVFDIAENLRRAWFEIGKHLPRGVKPTDSVCLAVTAILALSGEARAVDVVSDRLRGRAGRARSGEKKGGRENRQKMPSRPTT